MSIHITREMPSGWEYSVAVFHGLNFSAFLFIFFAYGYMYLKVRSSSRTVGSRANRELAIARKMTLIVLTDFCCWFPINVMGTLLLQIRAYNRYDFCCSRLSRSEWGRHSRRNVLVGRRLHFANQFCSQSYPLHHFCSAFQGYCNKNTVNKFVFHFTSLILKKNTCSLLAHSKFGD